MRDFEMSMGFYPGILLGFRTYPGYDAEGNEVSSHVLYLPFVSVGIEFYKIEGE